MSHTDETGTRQRDTGDGLSSSDDERPTIEPTVSPSTAALGVETLTKQFGEVVAVDDLSLGVETGELRAIIGPNGAGKTTLFNCIMGTLDPTAGTVYLSGDDITADAEERRPHLGMARSFQSNQLFADQTVLENIRLVAQTAEQGAFSMDLLRSHHTVGRERAIEIADDVGLQANLGTEATNLPHGEQRRLGIAMALATDPDVLLLDEPTSGMSPGATAETASLIEDIRDERGLTVILIEHDMDVVLSISDRLTVLDRGSIIATGPPDAVQGNQVVQDAYLGGMREEI
ncbi:amino acid/amide ABC transporter ATP-binding protein 1, HAAT family [Halovenus aranensis]|jgi:branched-chain amino acid transport system ATP-binding protein|uniref:Probable branched-chain amino acid transport ATP-binding protein LivG n=1 Tax=Halovenus aranensis TaxID=890420 RepID=A0A1G8SZY7_9EURY|nr:ABC transporter ATP-binding protein [Halovenus aranensis]SDJ34787.1 amino acid/amide ABC transporter ATP-binding protein 1, HAAT family [Halovenus aranensis]